MYMTKKNNSIVKYDNSFNKTSLSLLTKVQSDILMAVLQRMGKEVKKNENGNDCYVASYSFNEIRNMTNNLSLKSKRIKEMFDELLDTKVEIFEGDRYTKANLFSHYTLTGKSVAEITLSSELTKKLIIDNSEYTILNIDEYVELPNTYSKELYRILRQFRHSGIRIITKLELLQVLSPPKSYNEYNIIRKVILPALENNKTHFQNLSVNIEGNEIPNVVKFTFTPHKRIKAKQISELNKENDILQQYIEDNQK